MPRAATQLPIPAPDELIDTGARLVTKEEFEKLSGPVRTYRIGQWEWCPNQRRNAKSEPGISIRRKEIGITRAAYEAMGQPARVRLGWDGPGRRLAIVPDPQGQFKVNNKPTCIKFGGTLTVAWLAERGVKPGRYPAKWDGDKLVAEVG